ncbi:malonyl-CoA decarboxylase [Dichotomicrobium thermohalophilum]|uniref:Malonyl-CoA decarboxylase n=1 Tax=Dichotomicrobium thermohalophilum TaxID=933063 RepID=A0A397PK05_9HYPH|nr:malonyl-CoA decarboxylase [Dichotomicrobium thermohalophilum]RIA47595.1 malonyl-CoA decarboxylase [Dichotomicrobium thermohalophilum]
MNTSFFQELLSGIAERGRQLIDLSIGGHGHTDSIEELSRALMSSRGEAAGVALARRILNAYAALPREKRLAFFSFLNEAFTPDSERVREAAEQYLNEPGEKTLQELTRSVEPPMQEFLRRLNMAPGATAEIVAMRTDLLDFLKEHPELKPVDDNFVHLLGSWFNRGFLVLQRIDWSTPANILEKIIRYEAVHQIKDWSDLRRRLDPRDRRCYAFFHPSLIDEPLIFVQIALTDRIPGSIQELLSEESKMDGAREPSTAVFYSISNCQKGLAGISFGNFLIKQVAADLEKEIPSLRTFVTLSPLPGFRRWLERAREGHDLDYLNEQQRAALEIADNDHWWSDEDSAEALRPVLMAACAHYLLLAKTPSGMPADPVARFHLGNGARLERINWLGDVSEKGLRESYGLMVNYQYVLKDIERNHEALVNQGTVAASKAVRSHLLTSESSKALVTTG